MRPIGVLLRPVVLASALSCLTAAARAEPAPGFVTRWGGEGYADGQFQVITSIAIGPDHNVYVADGGLYRVSVFSPDGVFLRNLTAGVPRNIAVDDSGIVVSGSGNYVQPWGWQAADQIVALALLPNGNILLGFDNLVLLREYTRMGIPARDWATSGPGQLAAPASSIVCIPGGDIVFYDGQTKRFTTDGVYVATINLRPYIAVAASSTRLYCFTMNDREVHVLALDGQHVAQFGAGVIGFPIDAGVDGDTIYVADAYGQYIEKFRYGPVAITPATWSRVKMSYK